MNLQDTSNLPGTSSEIKQGAETLYADTLASLSEQDTARYQKMVDWYNDTALLENALAVDADAGEFDLVDENRQPTPLSELRKKGPVIIITFRGDWCAFCNYYMNLIAKSMNIFKDAGASFFAITPQKQFTRQDWQDMDDSGFKVLSDPDHQILRKFGLVYEVPEFIQELLLDLGVNLAELNGKWELPVTGVYIIDEDNKVAWRDIGKDFRYRRDPAEVVSFLKGN
jgi:peroxiredoxin